MLARCVLAALVCLPVAAWGQAPAGEGQPDVRTPSASEGVSEPDTDPDSDSDSDSDSESESGTESDTDSDSDQIIIIDDDEGGDPSGGDDSLIIIDDGDSSETTSSSPPPEPTSPPAPPERTWVTSEVSSQLGVDTSFSPKSGEDVVEWWNLGRLTLDHKQGDFRAVAEGRARWGVVGADTEPFNGFWLVNARNPKWTGEVELREAWVGTRYGPFQLEVGQRIYVWGKNELLAPADVVNPQDLRFGPSIGLDSLKDSKVPVFTVDVAWWHGDSAINLVVAPFFTASRATLVGRDWALAAPGSRFESQIRGVANVDPSVEDELQEALVGTELPEENLGNASIALRGVTRLGGWDLAATAWYGWDELPRVFFDDDLLTLLLSGERILADPQLLATEPELRDAALNVQQKSLVGQRLVSATYERQLALALEAEGVVGGFVVRADVGYTPGRVWYDRQRSFYELDTLEGALGAEYTRGEEWFVQVTALSIAALDPPDDAWLIGIERKETELDRSVAWMAALASTVRHRWEDWGLELAASGLYALEPGDILGQAELTYDDWEPHQLSMGVVLLGGRAGSLGGQWSENDYAYLAYRSIW